MMVVLGGSFDGMQDSEDIKVELVHERGYIQNNNTIL